MRSTTCCTCPLSRGRGSGRGQSNRAAFRRTFPHHRQPPENLQRHDLLLRRARQSDPPRTGRQRNAELCLRSARPTGYSGNLQKRRQQRDLDVQLRRLRQKNRQRSSEKRRSFRNVIPA